jgi:hypothetical protein
MVAAKKSMLRVRIRLPPRIRENQGKGAGEPQ